MGRIRIIVARQPVSVAPSFGSFHTALPSIEYVGAGLCARPLCPPLCPPSALCPRPLGQEPPRLAPENRHPASAAGAEANSPVRSVYSADSVAQWITRTPCQGPVLFLTGRHQIRGELVAHLAAADQRTGMSIIARLPADPAGDDSRMGPQLLGRLDHCLFYGVGTSRSPRSSGRTSTGALSAGASGAPTTWTSWSRGAPRPWIISPFAMRCGPVLPTQGGTGGAPPA